MIDGYRHPDIALNTGSMLRECIRHDNLAHDILYSNFLWFFFDEFVHFADFDVSSDAFNTLIDLLTTSKNKLISSEFIENNYQIFTAKYNKLITSDNYVTKRRSLKLLSTILLERCNFNIMIKYISSVDK